MSPNLERDALLQQADRILQKPDFSREDKAKVDSLIALADSVGGHNMALKRSKLGMVDTELGIRSELNAAHPQIEADFRSYLSGTHPSLLSEIGRKSIVEFAGAPRSFEGLSTGIPDSVRHRIFPQDGPIEARAEGVGSGAIGGYLSPQSFITVLESSLTQHDGLYEAATRFSTATGNAFTFPILADPTATSTIVAENFQGATGADFTFTGGISWGSCPTHRCGPISVSRELAQDSRFYLSTELATAFGERLARGAGQVFVTNLVNNAASAFTSASAASLTADEVIDLTCSVDEKYSARGAFLMRLSTYQAISKLKGSTSGDWLFPPGGRDALGRRTLAGYPVFTSPSMPPLQANARAVIFGDLSRFRIRQIENGIAVQTLVERYAEYGAIAYMLFARLDGALLKGADYGSPVVSGSPCKYILQHS